MCAQHVVHNICILKECARAVKVLSGGIEPLMSHKMYNGRCITAWLASCATELAQNHPSEEHVILAGCLPGAYFLLCFFEVLSYLPCGILHTCKGETVFCARSNLRVSANDLVLTMESAGRYLLDTKTLQVHVAPSKK